MCIIVLPFQGWNNFYKDVIVSKSSELMKQIRGHEKRIEIAAAIERLRHNLDFKLVEQELKDEITRLGLALAHKDLGSDEYQNVIRGMDAIGYTFMFVESLHNSADMLRDEVRQARRYLGELRED